MKVLIDTDWINFIQDLPSEKQSEILLAIMDYPNRKCELNCWKKIIEPCLERGRIGYFNRLQNLKQNKTLRTDTESVTESDTESDTVSSPTLSRVDDIDKDNNNIYNLNNILEENKKEINKEKRKEEFEEFWKLYTPVRCDGRVVDKGSKKLSFEKFIRILKSGENYETIIRGTKAYIKHCQANNQLTCGVPVFLNQQRWLNDYNTETVDGADSRAKRPEPRSIIEENAELALELEQKNYLY